MSRVEISGAVVVVTGAGSGIGAATSVALAEAGASVAAVDVDSEAAAATAAKITADGGQAHEFTCDVADPDAVGALVEAVGTRLGDADVLVNNAGVGLAGPFLDSSLADWQWIRGINLDSVVHGCHAFAPGMVDRGRGQIVNVASGAGYIASKHLAAYCATKAGVIMFSQCLRAELAGAGVGVSVVCPGVIDTPIASRTRYRGALEAKRGRAEWLLRHGRPPQAVANAVVDAVRRDRGTVPVGIDSHLGFRLLRFAPGSVQGLVTNRSL